MGATQRTATVLKSDQQAKTAVVQQAAPMVKPANAKTSTAAPRRKVKGKVCVLD